MLLRQIDDVLPSRSEAVQARLGTILAAVREEIDEGVEAGRFKPVDARLYATTIAGASMFWVAAQPVVERSFGIDPLAPESLEEFRDLLAHLTRRMLGVGHDGSSRGARPETNSRSMARDQDSVHRARRNRS